MKNNIIKNIYKCFSILEETILSLHPLYLIIVFLQIIPIGIAKTSQGIEIIFIFFENFESNSTNSLIDRLTIFFFIIFFLSCYIVYMRTILLFLSFEFNFYKDEYPFYIQVTFIMLFLPIWVCYLFISNGSYLFGLILLVVLFGFIFDLFYNIVKGRGITVMINDIYAYEPLINFKLQINKKIILDGGFLSTKKIRFSFPLLIVIISIYFFIINSFNFISFYKITDANWTYIKWFLILILVPINLFIIKELWMYLLKGIRETSKITNIPISKYLGYVSLFFILLPLLYRQSQSLFLLIFGFIFTTVIILQVFLLFSNLGILKNDLKKIGIVLILFFISLYSLKKDNLHQIRYIDNQIVKKEKVSANLKDWLNEKKNKPDSSLIFIIVSEGGGIRSAYWTAGLLNKIDSLFPEVINNTYAFSGVSGGSIGGVIYYSLKLGNVNDKHKWRAILGKDYLSSAMYGITIANTIQSFLPFTYEKLDRGNLLEDDFSKNFFSETNLNTLDSSIQILYNNNKIPNLFLNTTNVESGQKMIISNLVLDKDLFKNDIDFSTLCTKNISLKTAGLLSARFPGVSPSALIKLENNYNWGRILDGGFFDNSGLITALDIVKTIKITNNKLKPVILFIRNQNVLLKKDIKISNDFLSPIIAFYNSWDSKTEKTVNDCINSNDFDFIQFKLNYYDSLGVETNYPLGWTLSKYTQKSIDEKIAEIGTGKDKINLKGWNQLNRMLLK